MTKFMKQSVEFDLNEICEKVLKIRKQVVDCPPEDAPEMYFVMLECAGMVGAIQSNLRALNMHREDNIVANALYNKMTQEEQAALEEVKDVN